MKYTWHGRPLPTIYVSWELLTLQVMRFYPLWQLGLERIFSITSGVWWTCCRCLRHYRPATVGLQIVLQCQNENCKMVHVLRPPHVNYLTLASGGCFCQRNFWFQALCPKSVELDHSCAANLLRFSLTSPP